MQTHSQGLISSEVDLRKYENRKVRCRFPEVDVGFEFVKPVTPNVVKSVTSEELKSVIPEEVNSVTQEEVKSVTHEHKKSVFSCKLRSITPEEVKPIKCSISSRSRK